MTSYITSIQRATITIASSGTSAATVINSVSTANSAVFLSGSLSGDTGTTPSQHWVRVYLTDATHVGASRNTSNASAVTVYVTIVEFSTNLIASIEQNTITTGSGVSTNTATITSVTAANTAVFYQGATSTSTTSSAARQEGRLDVTNATTITMTRGTTSDSLTVGFVAIQFQSAVLQSLQARSIVLSNTNTSDTDTISAVVMANTMLAYAGCSSTALSGHGATMMDVKLATTTTATIARGLGTTGNRVVNYSVIEFKPNIIRTIERNEVTFSSGTSSDTAITTIDLAKSFLNVVGVRNNVANFGRLWTATRLTDDSTVRIERGVSTSETDGSSWEAIEFYNDILFDAASNSGYQAAASSYSWSHVCTGTDRYLVVGVAMLSLAQTVTGITYNSVALTLLGVQASISGACRIELWGLVAPAAGSHTIAVTLSGAIASAATASSFTGVHQTVFVEGFNSAQATNVGAADATVDVTTVADNDWVVDIVATDDGSIAVGAGQTSRANVADAGGSGAMSTEGPKTPAGSVTMSWINVAALATWAIGAVALRPISATVTSVVVGQMQFLDAGFIANYGGQGTIDPTIQKIEAGI